MFGNSSFLFSNRRRDVRWIEAKYGAYTTWIQDHNDLLPPYTYTVFTSLLPVDDNNATSQASAAEDQFSIKHGLSCHYFHTDKLALQNGMAEDLYAPSDLVVSHTTAAHTYLKWLYEVGDDRSQLDIW